MIAIGPAAGFASRIGYSQFHSSELSTSPSPLSPSAVKAYHIVLQQRRKLIPIEPPALLLSDARQHSGCLLYIGPDTQPK